ncbi:DNA polymerase I [Alkaliphilus peptidifermentans]|uniref:DNA polymerase I n=1 Tax=Alkaliphilus peptidifermentans DSM 18978 TaxID=1120976 RepID=A0A1G5CVK2_9FIRM|nr:DNA polymerase I [Alkaliphilus peptidifermentans]SCY06230.1 DNA polymerase I [Alkaliphilus peptidifermentans DSM 18978]
MIKDRIVIIDGNSLINRAFYALPPLVTKDGKYTNAMYGFLTMLSKIYDEYDPEYIGVAFDLKAPTFRHKEYGDYKLGRKKMPPELAEQMAPLKEILDALNVYRIEAEGFEADDLIGTLSKYCEKKGMESLIVTGDKDALQLASKTTKILITKKGISNLATYDDDAVFQEYEVTPLQFIDLKGLMGDKSDNIPGVPGVGEKTAIKLIKQFSSIEQLIQNTNEIVADKLREKIEAHIDDAVMSKRLATIITNVPVEIELESLRKTEGNYDQIVELFKRYEFNSLINRFAIQTNKATVEKREKITHRITDLDSMIKVKDIIKDAKKVAIKSITEENNMLTDKIICISMATDKDIFFLDLRAIDDHNSVMEAIKDILEADNIEIIGHDIKKEIIHFAPYNINLKNIVFDTMIGEYLIDSAKSTYGIKELTTFYLNETIMDEEELRGKGKQQLKPSNIDSLKIEEYMCQHGNAVLELTKPIMEKIINLDLQKLYYDVELPLTEVLASMEIEGIKVDRKMLEALKIEFGDKIDLLTKDIYALAGVDFNINSPKQLGEVLFEKLELPPIKKTKTGYSTNAEVLEKLIDRHEIIPKILEYRQVTKLKSTYVDGLLSIINPITERIHSSFNQTVTTTGRISSTEPNLQNIPVKLEMGRRLRKVFVAKEGYQFVDADYSQIELRVLAHISEDVNLLDAFEKDQDIHTRTASEIFDVPMDEVTSEMRSGAKAVNFGIVYGISDFGLGGNLNISRAKAKQYIESYLEKYSNVKKYMTSSVEEAKKKGYVLTLMNRRRYLPELHSSNFNIRSFGERIAMNTPIQGSAADIIKIAMVKVYESLKKNNLKAKLILQVHDELIIEAPGDELDIVEKLLKDCMENAIELKAQLKADLSFGDTWYDAK